MNVNFPEGLPLFIQNPMLDVPVSTLILNLEVVYEVTFSIS